MYKLIEEIELELNKFHPKIRSINKKIHELYEHINQQEIIDENNDLMKSLRKLEYDVQQLVTIKKEINKSIYNSLEIPNFVISRKGIVLIT